MHDWTRGVHEQRGLKVCRVGLRGQLLYRQRRVHDLQRGSGCNVGFVSCSSETNSVCAARGLRGRQQIGQRDGWQCATVPAVAKCEGQDPGDLQLGDKQEVRLVGLGFGRRYSNHYGACRVDGFRRGAQLPCMQRRDMLDGQLLGAS